jgi:hypothetical protein
MSALKPNPDDETTYLLFLSDIHATESWASSYFGDGTELFNFIAQAAAGYAIDNVTIVGDAVSNAVTDEKDMIQTGLLETALSTWSSTLDAATTGKLKDETFIYKLNTDTDIEEYMPQGEDGVLFVNGKTHEDGVKYTNVNGAYEYEDYIIYILGCDAFTKDGLGDYEVEGFTYETEGADIVAADLNAYLTRLGSKETRPVFICSHFPIYSARDGVPNFVPIVDTINNFTEKLDIVFLSGHNHTSDSEKEFFYPEGSNVAVGNGEGEYVDRQVNFTVMTDGYVNTNQISPNGNYTICEITDDFIIMNRQTVGELEVARDGSTAKGPSTGYLYTGKYSLKRNSAAAGVYGITYLDTQMQGKIELDKISAQSGETINVTATPKPGYVLQSLFYVSGGAAYAATVNSGADVNTGSFVMPASDVTAVRAVFASTNSGSVFKEVAELEEDGIYVIVGGLDEGTGDGYAPQFPRSAAALPI